MPDQEVNARDRMITDQTFDYSRLLGRVSAYIFEDEDLPVNYFSALSQRSDLSHDLNLTQSEWLFLQWNMDFVKRLVNNILPASMVYLVNKDAFGSFWTRELSRMTGVSEQKVNRWANKMAAKTLIKKKPIRTSFGLRIMYVATGTMPNINKLLLDLVLTKHRRLDLDSFLQKTREKTTVSRARMEQIRKYRRAFYKKKQY